MGVSNDVKDREPSAFDEALARFDVEVGTREPRRVSLGEIVELIRVDREAVHR